jgi:hypothetical protein
MERLRRRRTTNVNRKPNCAFDFAQAFVTRENLSAPRSKLARSLVSCIGQTTFTRFDSQCVGRLAARRRNPRRQNQHGGLRYR